MDEVADQREVVLIAKGSTLNSTTRPLPKPLISTRTSIFDDWGSVSDLTPSTPRA